MGRRGGLVFTILRLMTLTCRAKLGLVAGLVAAVLAGGCSSWKRSGASLESKSEATGRVMQPAFTTAVYRYIDPSTADVYLSDLPLERLMDARDGLSDVSGNIVQLHIFLVPQAGKTPIDPTACNVTIRHAVLANGAAGIYAGAGFSDISTLGGGTVSGDLLGATLRLGEATADFADALGPQRMLGTYKAELDEDAALALGDRMARLAAALPDVTPAKAEAKETKETKETKEAKDGKGGKVENKPGK